MKKATAGATYPWKTDNKEKFRKLRNLMVQLLLIGYKEIFKVVRSIMLEK
jgi:hypothetical protein